MYKFYFVMETNKAILYLAGGKDVVADSKLCINVMAGEMIATFKDNFSNYSGLIELNIVETSLPYGFTLGNVNKTKGTVLVSC